MTQPRRVLIVGCGFPQLSLIRAAKRRGWQVIGADANPRAVAVKLCDAFHEASTADVAALTAVVRKAQVEAKNHADGLIHQTEKTLKENEGKIAPADKAEAESAIAAVRTAMEGTDAAALKSASDRLTQVAMKIGEAMYKAQAEAGQGPGAPPPGGEHAAPHDDKVVDAEFEEVDETKKKAS